MWLSMSEKKSIQFIRKLAYVCLILSVAYVLSVGPVFAIFVSGKHDQAAYDNFIIFYSPIVWAEQKTPLTRVIGPYLMFWEWVCDSV